MELSYTHRDPVSHRRGKPYFRIENVEVGSNSLQICFKLLKFGLDLRAEVVEKMNCIQQKLIDMFSLTSLIDGRKLKAKPVKSPFGGQMKSIDLP